MTITSELARLQHQDLRSALLLLWEVTAAKRHHATPAAS
jgi:hypothetical protein